MSATVKVLVLEGATGRTSYEYVDRQISIVGRASDCHIRISSEKERASTVSRHHCILDINPPNVRVQDFGSLNGTIVNGEVIGKRQPWQTPEQGAELDHLEYDLKHGDTVECGSVVFRVEMLTTNGSTALNVTEIQCSRCGRSIIGDAVREGGSLVCQSCQNDLVGCVASLIRKAESGDNELAPIRGYELIREIGRGGQGIVFLAQHSRSGQKVALKVLLAQVASSPTAQKKFLREMSMVSTLRHENIVTFGESGASGGQFFFTSQYCEGGSVQDLVQRRGGTLEIEVAVPIILDILAGLEHAHTNKIRNPGESTVNGLVHRDVKPANMLLARHGDGHRALLADFGLAKAFDLAGLSGYTLTSEGSAGTLAYMSRQQLTNFKFVTPAVDVWSTAASLYWMLTGEPPRSFDPIRKPVKVVLEDEPRPIRNVNFRIPQSLAKAIDAALVEEPGPRVSTAAQFSRLLRNAM